MSMNLYLMDCYYRDPNAAGGFRQETINLKAPNETDGIREAQSQAIRRTPDFFKVRVSGRNERVVIYNSKDDA